MTVVAPRVSPRIISHKASTEQDKHHSLHFMTTVTTVAQHRATLTVSKGKAVLEPSMVNSSSPALGPSLTVLGQVP